MAPFDNAVSIIKATDEALRGLEDRHIGIIQGGLAQTLIHLQEELARVDRTSAAELLGIKDQSLRRKRAAALSVQIQAIMETIDRTVAGDGPDQIRSFVAGTYGLGIKSSVAVLNELQETNALVVTPDLVAIRMVAENAQARLHRHSRTFIRRAQEAVIEGLVQGTGTRKTSRILQEQTGVLLSNATRVVRTTSIQAMDEAQRYNYKTNAIAFVIRHAANDLRVCPYCAERHGKVYPIDDAPAAIHPHDRCTNLPFRPEWSENGIVDLQSLADERFQLRDKLRAAGLEPNDGPAPFERMEGKDPPKSHSIWEIQQGGLGRTFPVPLPLKDGIDQNKKAVKKAKAETQKKAPELPPAIDPAQVLDDMTRASARGDYKEVIRLAQVLIDHPAATPFQKAFATQLADMARQSDANLDRIREARKADKRPQDGESMRKKLAEINAKRHAEIQTLLDRKYDLQQESAIIMERYNESGVPDWEMTELDRLWKAKTAEMDKVLKRIDSLRKSKVEQGQKAIMGTEANAAQILIDLPSHELSSFQRAKTKRENLDGIAFFRRLLGPGHLDGKTVKVRSLGKGRSYYNAGGIYLGADKSRAAKVAAHELGHWFEDLRPDVHGRVVAFLSRRTAGLPVQTMNEAEGYEALGMKVYGPDEIGIKDKFKSGYDGKIYASDRGVYNPARWGEIRKALDEGDANFFFASEIVSRGFEYLYDDPQEFAERDPDFFDFIWSLIMEVP